MWSVFVLLTGRFVSGENRFVCLTVSFFEDQNHFVRFFPGINGSTEPNRVPNGPPPVPPAQTGRQSKRLMTIQIGYRLSAGYIGWVHRLGTSACYRPVIGWFERLSAGYRTVIGRFERSSAGPNGHRKGETGRFAKERFFKLGSFILEHLLNGHCQKLFCLFRSVVRSSPVRFDTVP